MTPSLVMADKEWQALTPSVRLLAWNDILKSSMMIFSNQDRSMMYLRREQHRNCLLKTMIWNHVLVQAIDEFIVIFIEFLALFTGDRAVYNILYEIDTGGMEIMCLATIAQSVTPTKEEHYAYHHPYSRCRPHITNRCRSLAEPAVVRKHHHQSLFCLSCLCISYPFFGMDLGLLPF